MILSLDNYEAAATRRLPAGLRGFVAGGCEDDVALRGNRAAFTNYALLPRTLVGALVRSQSVELFGTTFTAPFGIAPMGGNNLSVYRADQNLAAAAHRAGIPFVLSGASSVRLEDIAAINPDAWFQAYLPYSREDKRALVMRVAEAGYKVLVVTVDMTLPGNREHNRRNGFSMPVRVTPRLVAQSLAKPRWLAGTFLRTMLESGGWFFENRGAGRTGNMLKAGPADLRRGTEALDWDDLEFIRDLWRGSLVVKGILSADDAARARGIGVDGVVVSNHGGRQLDGAIASLHALPAIVAAAGPMVVMLDSGIRRGTDVLKALALGAHFVFAGRPFLYGAIIGGQAGAETVARILRDEIDRNQALLGCMTMSDITRDHVAFADRPVPSVFAKEPARRTFSTI